MLNQIKIALIFASILALTACNPAKDPHKDTDKAPAKVQEKAEVLPYLNVQAAKAKYAIPFCEKKDCIDIDIQTVQTADPWLNEWALKKLANVVQDQIHLNQNLNLQEAVNAYVKKSDAWQAQFKKNQAYALDIDTRVASQRNQYVLLQISVDSKQEDVTVKERQYFYVADRKLKKDLVILDVIEPKQKKDLDQLIQDDYQEWLKGQGAESKKLAPKKLLWEQAEWFFDTEGVGLHFRPNQIVKDGTQLDIYLSKVQTQKILKADIFQKMF